MKRPFILATCVVALGLLLAPSSGAAAGDPPEHPSKPETLKSRLDAVEARLSAVEKDIKAIRLRVEATARSSQVEDLRKPLHAIQDQLSLLTAKVDRMENGASEKTGTLAVEPSPTTKGEAAKADGERSEGRGEETGGGPAREAAPTPALFDRALEDYQRGAFEKAASEFRRFLAAFPKDPRTGSAHYGLGMCLFDGKAFAEAEKEFLAVLKDYPDSPEATSARLKLGLCHLALDEFAQGAAVLKALIKEKPDSEEALIAKERLAGLQSP